MKMRMFVVLLFCFSGAIGCAMLQGTPTVEISAAHLSSEGSPAMVDGDLETIGIFKADGTIQKGFERRGGGGRQYRRRVVGDMKTETLIKLDTPKYVEYIEVYPASTIRRLTVDTTATEKSSQWTLSFEPVEDKRGEDIEGTKPVRLKVGREVLYLRLTAFAAEDLENVGVYSAAATKEMAAILTGRNVHPEITEELRRRWRKQRIDGEMQIPLKGAAIREVKFYGRP